MKIPRRSKSTSPRTSTIEAYNAEMTLIWLTCQKVHMKLKTLFSFTWGLCGEHRVENSHFHKVTDFINTFIRLSSFYSSSSSLLHVFLSLFFRLQLTITINYSMWLPRTTDSTVTVEFSNRYLRQFSFSRRFGTKFPLCQLGFKFLCAKFFLEI